MITKEKQMAFKEVVNLEAELTTALGGRNKTTGKANPTQVEGYYLGTKKVESRKAKSGFADLHILQTAEGNLGVWGKTDLDRKMKSVPAGSMIRVTQNGTVPTPNGDMYKFKVEVDASNTIEVNLPTPAAEASDLQDFSSNEPAEEAFEDESFDEVAPARVAAPKKPLSVPDAARQAKIQALLNGSGRTK